MTPESGHAIEDHTWIEAAVDRIASRLTRTAIWSSGSCTWLVGDIVDDRPARKPAGWTLYDGTAGTALFLAEAADYLGDGTFGDAALAALRFSNALEESRAAPSLSFYTGSVGLLFAAARIDEIVGSNGSRLAAKRLAERVRDADCTSAAFDLIQGAASAIPALLLLSDRYGFGWAEEKARQLGQWLVENARRWSGGWSWPTIGAIAHRDLYGFAHGASGIGLSLLVLADRFGDASFAMAAERAFAYERAAWDASTGSLPDVRGPTPRQRSRQRDSRTRTDYQLTGHDVHTRPVLWCHGAPGNALARARAWEITGDEYFRLEIVQSVVATRESCRALGRGCSLCHGLVGNALVVLRAGQALSDPSLRSDALAILRDATERYGSIDAGWPSGVGTFRGEPTLMLGDAGIGYAIMGLNRSMVSVLCPQDSVLSGGKYDTVRSEAWRQRDIHASTFFERTLAALNADERSRVYDTTDLPSADPVRAVRTRIERIVGSTEHPAAAMFALESARAALLSGDHDVIAVEDQLEFQRLLGEAELERSIIRLSKHVMLLEQGDRTTLLIQHGNGVEERALGRVGALVLGLIGQGHAFEALVISGTAALGLTPASDSWTTARALVISQLVAAVRAGVLEATATAIDRSNPESASIAWREDRQPS
jgi:hypothetical protein